MNIYSESTILFITFFINYLIGLFVLFKAERSDIDFAYTSFYLSFWIFCFFVASLVINNPVTVLMARLTVIGALLFPFHFMLFCANFVGKTINRKIAFVYYVIAAIIIAVSMATKYYLKEVRIIGGTFDYLPGNYYYIVPAVLLVLMIASFYLLIMNYNQQNYFKRNQIKYLFTGVFTSILIGSITNIFLPILGYRELNFFGPFGTIFFIAFTAYAITKHRLMNISVVISRTVAWAITILFLGSIYVLLAWLYRTFVTAQIDWIFLAGTVLYGILVGVSFQKIRLFLQTAADRAFIKGWYDYREVLRKVATGLAKALTREDIVKTLYPIFQDDIDISESHLYFLDRSSATFIEWDPKTLEPRKESALTKDYFLVKQVSAQKEVAVFDKKLCVPSFSGGDLVALFVLGKKRSEDEYNDDDIELFRTVSEYVAIALEYIVKPYEEVKERFETTEKKLFETEKQLERSQRLASLGTVAAGVAHEIRNPLAVISLKTQNLPDTEELRDFKNIVIANTERATAIIKQMVMLSKPKERKEIEINLNELIDATLKLFAISRIRLILDLKELPLIKCDPDEMRQVFINLIDNAIHAMPEGGDLTIASRYIEEPPSVQIEISDTGAGIPDEIKEKIFDPFFSTRHEGAGLGLSIAYRIVREHGGNLEFKTKVGKGTTFIIKCPVIKSTD